MGDGSSGMGGDRVRSSKEGRCEGGGKRKIRSTELEGEWLEGGKAKVEIGGPGDGHGDWR